MSVLTFKQKMYMLCGLGVISAISVGGIGYYGQIEESAAFRDNVTLSHAQRNHLEGDMMHDALRADMLAAMLAGSQGQVELRESIETDFNEHATLFRQTIESNRALPLSTQMRTKVDEIAPALETYINETQSIIDLAFKDISAANAKKPAFTKSWELLAERMGKLTDDLSTVIEAQEAQAIENEQFFRTLSLSVIGLFAALIIIVGGSIIRGVLRQLGGEPAYATEIVRRVARGELDVHVQRDVAMGESLLAAIDDMRQKLKANIDEITRASEQQRITAAEAARVKQALNVCDTAALIVNAQGKIIYVNRAIEKMFAETATHIGKLASSFNANRLLEWDINLLLDQCGSPLRGLRETRRQRIVVNALTFDLSMTPIHGEDRSIIGYVLEWHHLTEMLAKQAAEQKIAQENSRVRQALDNVSSNTMIADNNGNIVYMNRAVLTMMKTAESDLRKALPHFNADQLIGTNFDVFHKNPAHQRNLLANLTTIYRTQITVAGRTFSLIANPIVSETHERIGSVVEWNDRTQEVAIEGELKQLLTAANDGDLSKRIDLIGKEGFYRALSEGLNGLMNVADDVISNASRVMDALAHGRLNERIESSYKGAFDKLKTDANATVDRLVSVVEQISESARAVATGAQEIAQGNTDLSQRTEEQASSLEETASSMEEMTSTVRQSSENARHANTLAIEARERASRGGEMVSRAVNAMGAISTSSKKIADIISVIDEIAFQTNLLALNAAVEAARAGEQGRGFAVVAGEVRSLAQRSASAAKEIKDLIRDSVTKVQDGTQLVNESGETLKELVISVQRVSNIVQEIATAAVEQTAGIEQVNTAVSQMDEMTQQNAALVEEASAAGEALSEQARHLLDLISFFDSGRGRMHKRY